MEHSFKLMLNRSFMISLVILSAFSAHAQNNDRKLVQFSGVVVTSDSLDPVAFTNVIINNTRRGTMTDVYGYFSFVAQEEDTIVFSAVGYQRSSYRIPTDLEDNKYSLIHLMTKDTVELGVTTIYPWPSKEQFREAFLTLNIPDNDDMRVARNVAQEDLAMLMSTTAMDGSENYSYSMRLDQTKLYYSGQAPSINLFNPVAWSQFIQAWQRGDFKNKNKP